MKLDQVNSANLLFELWSFFSVLVCYRKCRERQCCTGWYLVILGHYNLVLCGIKWYWVNKGLLCLYILKKNNGDVNRPTNQPTDQQGEYRAICLFRKLENRKKAEICNYRQLLSASFVPSIIGVRLQKSCLHLKVSKLLLLVLTYDDHFLCIHLSYHWSLFAVSSWN